MTINIGVLVAFPHREAKVDVEQDTTKAKLPGAIRVSASHFGKLVGKDLVLCIVNALLGSI